MGNRQILAHKLPLVNNNFWARISSTDANSHALLQLNRCGRQTDGNRSVVIAAHQTRSVLEKDGELESALLDHDLN
jgi:hypothetical protein